MIVSAARTTAKISSNNDELKIKVMITNFTLKFTYLPNIYCILSFIIIYYLLLLFIIIIYYYLFIYYFLQAYNLLQYCISQFHTATDDEQCPQVNDNILIISILVLIIHRSLLAGHYSNQLSSGNTPTAALS